MQQFKNRLSFPLLSSVFFLTAFCGQGPLTAAPTSETTLKLEAMDNLELLISQEAIQQRIADIALAIDEHYAGEELTVVLLMKGALCVGADLIRALKTPCTIECVKASSYGQLGVKRGELTITGLDRVDLTSKNVLVVDDIIDSGETMSRVFSELNKKNPKSIKSLVLLSKKVPRTVSFIPDYVLFEIEDLFVIGYGLDYKEFYRGLPGVYFFKQVPE